MVIDFHSHILPGIDDGSRSVDQSIAMLEREVAQGMVAVVATPHFYAQQEDLTSFLGRRAQAEYQLRRAMKDRQDLPKLLVGAEVSFFTGMGSSETLSQLTIDGTGCILIEMPPPPWTPAMYRELEEIYTRQNLLPIVAHVDRYIRPWRTYGIPERLAGMPVLVQANAAFFLHRSSRRMALRLLKEDKIQLLGSDCHDLDVRAPVLGSAVDWICRHCDDGLMKRIAACQDMALMKSGVAMDTGAAAGI